MCIKKIYKHFTAEEIWDYLPKNKDKCISVHLTTLPKINPQLINSALSNRWEHLNSVCTEVNKALDIVRKNKIIGNSLQARLTISASPKIKKFLEANAKILTEITMVSELIIISMPANLIKTTCNDDVLNNIKIEITPVTYPRCSRCWIYSPTVGININYPELCHRCILNIT